MIKPAPTVSANSVRGFIVFGLLSAVLISLKTVLTSGPSPIGDYFLPPVVSYGLMGIAIYRSRALTGPQTALFVVAMILVSLLITYGLNIWTVMPQLLAYHVKPQIIAHILSHLTWLNGGLTALVTLAFFRGRSPIAVVALIVPGPLAAGIFSFAMLAPQVVGLGMPDLKVLQVISIFASQIIYAVTIWVVATNGNRPVEPGFISITLKRPPDLHWLSVVMLTLFSGGGFATLWSIVQACWAKGVDEETTALRSCLGAAVVLVIAAVLILLLPFLQQGHLRAGLILFAYIAIILGATAYWFGVFAIATSIEIYARTVQSRDLRLNRFWVFLVAVPYLQFHLSRLAAHDRENDRISAVAA